MRKIICILFLACPLLLLAQRSDPGMSINDLGSFDPMNKSGKSSTAAQEKAISDYLDQYKTQQVQQEVSQQTYQKLESQTRALQSAAEWNRGEGARQMIERYGVHSVMRPLEGQAFSAEDLHSHLPQQQFIRPLNALVIDPDRHYNLATMGGVSSEDLHDDTKLPIPSYSATDNEAYSTEYEDAEPMTRQWIKEHPVVAATASIVSVAGDDAVNIATNIMEDGVTSLLPKWLKYDEYKKILKNAQNIFNAEMSIANQSVEMVRWAALNADNVRSGDVEAQLEQYQSGVNKEIDNLNSKTMKQYLHHSPYETPTENINGIAVKVTSKV